MMMNQCRPGMGTSVKRLNAGAIDRPLASETSFVSHSGFCMPS